MVNPPEVSVIIPTYNRGATIVRALRSVYCQTYQDFEIILVDDCSTDETTGIVEAERHPRLRIIRHLRNLGAAAARNSGVGEARGNYFAFLDSDDEWLPEKLAVQVSALKNARNRIQASTTASIRVEGIRRKIHVPSHDSMWLKVMLSGCDQGPGSTLLVSRQAWEEIGGLDTSLRRLEDWDWLIRYTKRYDLLLVPTPLSVVYVHETPSMTSYEEALFVLFNRYEKDMDRFGWVFKRKVISHHLVRLAWKYQIGQRNLAKEKKYLTKALIYNPFQHPNVYVAFMDAILGTSLRQQLSAFKYKVRGKDEG